MNKILIIVFIAFMTLAFIISAVTPIFDTLCKNEAISMATIIANNKATEVMAKHTYDELFSIEKDESGNIKMIKSNVIPINEIRKITARTVELDLNYLNNVYDGNIPEDVVSSEQTEKLLNIIKKGHENESN